MNDSSVLVSISCLTYNHAPYLRDCFDGFLSQKTGFEFEVLIHDDCSSDGSVEIIKSYTEKYPHIFKPLFEKENQFSQGIHGGTILWNLPRAKGRYIAICEGDDYWTDPYKLQKQVDYMDKNPGVGLCYTDYNLYEQVSGVITKDLFKNGKHRPVDFRDFLVNEGYIAPMSWLIRRSVLESLDVAMYTDLSYSIALAMLKQSKVYYLPETTCVYRSHPGSASDPLTDEGYFKQYYGVFKTKLFFAEKYQVDQSTMSLIKSGGYVRLLPYAMRIHQDSFIEEARSFFSGMDFHMDSLIALCKYYNISVSDCRNARNSKSYRLGRALLHPFNLLKALVK